MLGKDARRLSLILLVTPFLLWILLLILLPQLGMTFLSFHEELGPGDYEFGLGN